MSIERRRTSRIDVEDDLQGSITVIEPDAGRADLGHRSTDRHDRGHFRSGRYTIFA